MRMHSLETFLESSNVQHAMYQVEFYTRIYSVPDTNPIINLSHNDVT